MEHATIQMTMRSAHLALEHNQAAVEELVSSQQAVATNYFSASARRDYHDIYM
jgi:hypothetical protein